MNPIMKKILLAILAIATTLGTIMPAYAYPSITVGDFTGGGTGSLRITNVDVTNRVFDPWNGEEAAITFTINKDAYMTLEILNEDNETVNRLVIDEMYNDGTHTVIWNGEDEFGDKVAQGDYEYELTAYRSGENDTETGTLIVERGQPGSGDELNAPVLKNVYVTKENFDPNKNEKTEVVFTLTEKADVEVAVFDVSKKLKIKQLMDEENRMPGTYKIEWDGDNTSDNNDTYTYKIVAINNEGDDTAEGNIVIEEENGSSDVPDVYKDKINQIPYNPRSNNLSITFNLDKKAEITIEIRKNGDTVAEVADNENMPAGPQTVSWNGKNQYGEYADDGVYQYKIKAGNTQGIGIEEGNFSIEGSSEATYGNTCAGFADVNEEYAYCEAIQWAKDRGIFQGYSDGTFKPEAGINRAEALKVIFEALDVEISQDPYQSIFSDVPYNAWYTQYVYTALELGIVQGYANHTFRPENVVTRAEALKMLLETGKIRNNIVVPTGRAGYPYYDTTGGWYMDYAWFAKENHLTDNDQYLFPNYQMTRGAMADMLYRYYTAGLLK